MTVQMTMEEYKELESKAEKLDAITKEIESVNKVATDTLFHRAKFLELVAKIGIKIPSCFVLFDLKERTT